MGGMRLFEPPSATFAYSFAPFAFNAFAISTISQGFAQKIVLDYPSTHPYSEERAKVSAALPGYLPSLAPELETHQRLSPQ